MSSGPRLRIVSGHRIDTERLILRPPKAEDAARIAELLRSWDVARWLVRVPYPYRIEHAEAWIERSEEERVVGVGWPFLITLRTSGKIIGSMDMSLESNLPVGALGYWLGEDYWDGGYATEAATAMVEFAFDVLNLDAVIASALPDNERSMKVLRKAGLFYVDRRVEDTVERGKVDTEFFSVDRETWREGGVPR